MTALRAVEDLRPEPPPLDDLDAPPEFQRSPTALSAHTAQVSAGPSEHEDTSRAFRAPSPVAGPELEAAALQGLAGDVVGTIGPETEADPVAILGHLLLMFGNCVGRAPHAKVGPAIHPPNLFAVFVGASSKGRKGTAASAVQRLLEEIDGDWGRQRVLPGLSSGEGLIWAVRDPIHKKEPIREKGRIVSYESAMVDEGITDKRLMVLESEFASVLRVLNRDGNTLSALVRQAWDTGSLGTLTKNSTARATDAHISIIGHVTKDELLRYLDRTETANGFGNRFLWFCTKRSKLLPEGGDLGEHRLAPLRRQLAQAVDFARTCGDLRRDGPAREAWAEIYLELSAERPGLAGALTARGEAQVLRLSLVYALLDRSPTIQVKHLEAALAVWRYSEESVLAIFGETLGDPLADDVEKALRANPLGLTRNDIRGAFQGHQSSERIERALSLLAEAGRAVSAKESGTGGRAAERWRAVGIPARKARYARKVTRAPGEDHASEKTP